jgi:hypothetical protein
VAADQVRGWGSVAALALATAFLSVVHPGLLIFVPLALLIVALPPRRPVLLALAGFIGWMVFSAPAVDNVLWYFERGWALLLGAWFVVLVLALPGSRFMARALGAVGATVATSAIFMIVNRNGFAELDSAVTGHLSSEAVQARRVLERFPALAERASEYAQGAAELSANLFPALLALASLAALGVAWWAFGRIAQGERQPLGRLREFRFRNELVWLMITGMVLLLLPLNQLATRAGENLLMFMAVLYALRGAGVLLVIGGVPGPVGVVIGAALLLFLYPLVMVTTVIVGLSDTWLDIRARREAPSSPGS